MKNCIDTRNTKKASATNLRDHGQRKFCNKEACSLCCATHTKTQKKASALYKSTGPRPTKFSKGGLLFVSCYGPILFSAHFAFVAPCKTPSRLFLIVFSVPLVDVCACSAVACGALLQANNDEVPDRRRPPRASSPEAPRNTGEPYNRSLLAFHI